MIQESFGSDHVISKKLDNFYAQYYKPIKKYVLNNSGTSDDALDLLQEVAIVYFTKAQTDEIREWENEKNYILAVARNKWLKKIKERSRIPEQEAAVLGNIADIDTSESAAHGQHLILDLVLNKLNEISEECRKIIHAAFYLKLHAAEIAEVTGYSEKFIKVKKYRCLQGLRKAVFASEDYRKMSYE